MSASAGAYAQLFGLGLPWVALHCGAMCGPLAAGLTAPLPSRSARVRAIGAYQLGRALVYLPLGALAGALGHALEPHPTLGAIAGLSLGFVLVLMAASGGASPSTLVPASSLARKVERSGALRGAWASARSALARGQVFPVGVAGFVLGALPCMLPAWVLSLAASTGSALHGAMLMALLLVASAAPLTASALVLPGKKRGSLAGAVPRVALAVAALWLVLGALATMQVVAHGRLVVLGRTLTFW